MSNKSVKTLRSKIQFASILDTFCPLPPQTMVILLFPRLHRPQRLHNIKLRAGNIIELRLNVKELKEEVNYGKVSFSECVSITFVASCSLIS